MIPKAAVAPVLALVALVCSTQLIGQSPADKLPVYSGDALWTSVVVKDLRVLMPAKPGEVLDETSPGLQSIHALTTTGTFSVVIKQVDQQLDMRQAEALVNDVAVATLTAKTKLLDKHEVEYEGVRGEQVTYIEESNRVFARIFYLNDRLIVLSATFKSADYRPEFDILVDHFFDSVRMKLPLPVA